MRVLWGERVEVGDERRYLLETTFAELVGMGMNPEGGLFEGDIVSPRMTLAPDANPSLAMPGPFAAALLPPEGRWAIVVGSIENGLSCLVGPFDTRDKAESVAESHNWGHEPWTIVGLDPVRATA